MKSNNKTNDQLKKPHLRGFFCSMQVVVLAILAFSLTPVLAQEEYESELLEIINDYRFDKGLVELETDEILTAVAFDQAEYISKVNKVTHEQESSKKKTLKDRLHYFNGLFYSAGENASIIGVGSKASIQPKGAKITIENESMGLEAAFASWIADEESRQNIEDPTFYAIGISVIVNDKNEMIIVSVLGSAPYRTPNAKKVPHDLYGIEEYKKSECDKFLTEYPTLPELFSDVLSVENGEVILTYHNANFLRTILKDGKDKLAVDIVDHTQFNCSEGNRIYPGNSADGYLLPPIGKSAFNYRDQDSTDQGLKISFGKAPAFYKTTSSELNLIFIKNGVACVRSNHNKVTTSKSSFLENDLIVEGKSTDPDYKWKDSVVYAYYPTVDKNWKEDIEKQLKLIERLQWSSRKIQLEYTVVDLVGISLESSINTLANNYGFDNVTKINQDSNFLSKLNGTFYQFDLDELKTKKEKQDFVKNRLQNDLAFKALTDSVITIKLSIEGNASISGEIENSALIALYEKLYYSGRNQAALYLQQQLLGKLKKKQIGANQLPAISFDQTQEDLKLLNNAIIQATYEGRESYDGNKIYLAFLELYLIDKDDPIIRFNCLNTTLQYWKDNPQSINNSDNWLRDFKVLLSSSIPKEDYFRVLLNYYMLMTDYYYETNQFEKRKKAFLQIQKTYNNTLLSPQELLNFVQFLGYQDQFQFGVEVLEQALKKETIKSHLLYYLQIAQYGKNGTYNDEYVKWLSEASRDYSKEFCELFGVNKMGRQLLKNEKAKAIYCRTCQ